MFPVTITLHNAGQLTAVMAALGATSVAFDESTPIKTAVVSPSTTDDFPERGMEAPEKSKPASSAAKTAPSPRTAEAAPAPASAAPAPSTEATPPAAAAPSASPQAEFDYATLQKAVVAAAPKHGKAKLLEIAVKHGAPDFKSLPAGTWQAAHADVIALG